MKKRLGLLFCLCMILILTSGCFFTKLVTVPMRFGAATVSIVPVAGNTAHDTVDEAAATIDKAPF